MKNKKCTKCLLIKNINEFHVSKIFSDKHNNWCKLCMSSYHKKYSKIPYVKIKQRLNSNKWVKNNIEKAREKSNKWKSNNKDKVNEYSRKYCAYQRKTNIDFVIAHSLRNRVRIALFGNPRFETTMKLVGCSINKLKVHLETQFKPDMTWNNYGRKGWSIDHIRPCALFDLSKLSEQKKCFHYTNLQPLWEKENCSKQDKY